MEMLQSLLASLIHLIMLSIKFNAALSRPGDYGKSETQFERLLLEGS